MEQKLKKENLKTQKKIKSQIPQALVMTFFIVLFGFYLNDIKLVSYLIFGLAFGIVLQRARFCFTAAFREPILIGDTSLARGVIVAVSIGTIGFTAISFGSVLAGGKPVGLGAVNPVSILTVVGGIIFGIGMVMAGGCASGTLMRFGEGFELQWVSFVFFVLGSVIGTLPMGVLEPIFDKKELAIYLPDIFGWIGALIFQFTLILITYVIALKWQKKKLGTYD